MVETQMWSSPFAKNKLLYTPYALAGKRHIVGNPVVGSFKALGKLYALCNIFPFSHHTTICT